MCFLQTYTVSFFGHREINRFTYAEKWAEEIIRQLIEEYPYVEFLVGRDGEFDQIASSAIRRTKRIALIAKGNTSMNRWKAFGNHF